MRLGVDTVELMPIAAWIDERHLPALGLANAWGYNPVTFMAPDPRLAPGGLAEVRSAVQALHEAGIRVHPRRGVQPYRRERRARRDAVAARPRQCALLPPCRAGPGMLVNDTGCGNTLALDRAAGGAAGDWTRCGTGPARPASTASASISPRCWGARIAGFDRQRAAVRGHRRRIRCCRTHLCRRALGCRPRRLSARAVSGAHGRNGTTATATMCAASGAARTEASGALATRLAGSSDIFAASGRAPSRSINFIAAHDGFTLRDLVSYDAKHNQPNGEDNRDGSSHEISWNNGAEGRSDDAGMIERRHRDQRALLPRCSSRAARPC